MNLLEIKRKFTIYLGKALKNISRFSRVLLPDCRGAAPQFFDFEGLLEYIDQLSVTDERMIIVIDKFPYLVVSYPAISSMLQSHIDLDWKKQPPGLNPRGSSMSFMEKRVLGYKIPLYGRRTAQFISILLRF